MNAEPRLLVIGPLPIEGDVIGGTKVMFQDTLSALEESGRFAVEVVNTSRSRVGRGRLRRAWGDFATLFGVLARLLSPRARYDAVFFNASSGGLLRSGPLVWAACRLRRWPLVVRHFGGDLDVFLERATSPGRALAERTVLRPELLLLETRALCERFETNERVRWWPNTRDLRPPIQRDRQRDRGLGAEVATRFLFLSQLRPSKGAAEAIAAASALPAGATLDLYGPEMPGFDVRTALVGSRCRWHGPIPSEEVPAVLAAHDVLVFPSTHGGEGLPGVLIEALQSGLPVIATRWRALPEVVEDGWNGLLVEPRDLAALTAAMERLALDADLFRDLRRGALESGERYRMGDWGPKLCGWLEELCGVEARRAEALREAA